MDPFAASDATILLVVSGPVMRAALRDALENAGYLVVTAGDLAEAIDRLKEMAYDLLIIRPYIDSMPGRIAADNLRGRRPGLPVLMVSGLIDDDRVMNEYAVEDFHIFPKPFSRDELLTQVREVLRVVRNKR